MIEPTPTRLEIAEEYWQNMLAHLQNCLPEEGCGLLGGRLRGAGEELTARVSMVLPVENELHSPTRFRMDPARLVQAFYTLEEQGLELSAIFHSHPTGPQIPSPTDRGEFAYPGVLAVICSRAAPSADDDWVVRAFQITGIFDPNAAINEVSLLRLGATGPDLRG